MAFWIVAEDHLSLCAGLWANDRPAYGRSFLPMFLPIRLQNASDDGKSELSFSFAAYR